MKSPQILTLGGLTLAAVSCGSFKNLNGPLGSGGFDPLDAPGSTPGTTSAVVAPAKPSYQKGQWVETSMSNATFFRSIPRGNATADRVLARATPLKVVSSTGTYVKVELDSGEVGYVPEIMLITRGSQSPVPGAPDYGPVPPPVGPGNPIPGVPPAPEIPGTPLSVPPAPSIPAPSVPGTVPTVPDVAPPPEVPGITVD